ncbi:predicted protein [Aspergillus nidulans FGSC A4]|uniref:Uncharacterized protein n=1 Tax=Emericella nidulans (strain FGSC A4 / ATCC 38163 / CBS 112.46 / NRRL 194 / M139) TaxID=227321 RepID=Q5B8G4_EMENI|nr:hypothetical protein [Aspergillus nidulans FGSC A4]EAA63737.1 predicted protein [Aspergillus nidulans FGSC A4]CBF83275.1 TPA: hypothetical protein ANIA_03166 [Aspergillus nidulans FGSC A4]|eukprot:XP_660770.1 predicted protein [Aspergillus nidulans FGSC A4]
MRIINPQDATLTNIEVLSYLTANPPRRPPTAPPGVNQKHFIPSPDLRDHNTVVKEIHNYASRLAPHLLRYPTSSATATSSKPGSGKERRKDALDHALRELVTRLQPYGLTKGEVLMIVNLGVGISTAAGVAGAAAEGGVEDGFEGVGAERMDVDEGDPKPENGEGVEQEGAEGQVDGKADGEGGEGEGDAGDYGALALIDTIIEEREQRLSDENVVEILAIVRETLGAATS